MNFNFFDNSNLREKIVLNLDLDKTEFTKRFKDYLDYDRGFMVDELYSSKKEYLGEINTDKFVLRKKRKFMNPNIQSSNAKGKIIDFNGKTKLEIEISGTDEIAHFGLIIAPIFFLILFIVTIINEAYPTLIIFVPLAILFLTFPRVIMKNNIKKFKNDLVELLTHL